MQRRCAQGIAFSVHNKHERKTKYMKTYVTNGLLGVAVIAVLINADRASGRGAEDLVRLHERPAPKTPIVEIKPTVVITPNTVGVALDSSIVHSAANKAFPKLLSEMTLDELLNKVGSDGSMRGNLRGQLTEEDFFNREKSWTRTKSKTATQNDGWRWVGGKVGGKMEGVQLKVHSNWKNYVRSMRDDFKAEHFVIPDDHYKLVSADLEERIAGAIKGRKLEKVAEYRKMQSRLKPLGRTFGQLDQAIEDAALGATQAAKAAASAGKAAKSAESAGKLGKAAKVLGGVGVLGAGAQAYGGIQEIKAGETVKGSVHLGGSAANATSAIAGLAGKAVLSGGAGAVGAGIDGGLDLYTGISTGDTKKTVVGSIKSAAAVGMAAGTATLNPVVLGTSAVAYGGVVVGELVYDNWDTIAEGTRGAVSSAYNWIFYEH